MTKKDSINLKKSRFNTQYIEYTDYCDTLNLNH